MSELCEITDDQEYESEEKMWADLCVRNLNLILRIALEFGWPVFDNISEEVEVASDILGFAGFLMVCHGNASSESLKYLYESNKGMQEEFNSVEDLKQNIVEKQKKCLDIMEKSHVDPEYREFLSKKIYDINDDEEVAEIYIERPSHDYVQEDSINVSKDREESHFLDNELPLAQHVSVDVVDYLKAKYNPLDKKQRMTRALKDNKFDLKDISLGESKPSLRDLMKKRKNYSIEIRDEARKKKDTLGR